MTNDDNYSTTKKKHNAPPLHSEIRFFFDLLIDECGAGKRLKEFVRLGLITRL